MKEEICYTQAAEDIGYTEETAILEASRCLKCKKAPCQDGCPAGIIIPEFLELIKQGNFKGANSKVREKKCINGTCQSPCCNEHKCENKCVLDRKGKAIKIYDLELFVAAYSQP